MPEKPKGRKAAKISQAHLPPGCNPAMSRDRVAAALDISTRKLTELIADGLFPKAEFHIGVLPRWRMSTVNAWVASAASGDIG